MREASGSSGGRVAPSVLLLFALGFVGVAVVKAGPLCPIVLVRAVSATTADALIHPSVAISLPFAAFTLTLAFIKRLQCSNNGFFLAFSCKMPCLSAIPTRFALAFASFIGPLAV